MTTSTHPADTSNDGARIDTTRDAMQQALEALERIRHWSPLYRGSMGVINAIAALKAALAEQDDDLTAAWMAGAAEGRKRAEQAQPLTDACTKLLQEALPHAEWQDKHIHPVGRESYQNWKVTVYLPVPLSEADKSPQAALARAVEAEVLKRMGVQR